MDFSDPAQVDAYLSARVRVEEGCWVWTLAPGSHGYGQIQTADRKGLAHRFSYEHHVGAIPEGLHLDHLCRNRMCINPDHLEPVTQAENIRRGQAPSAIAHRNGTCQSGHPLTEATAHRGKNGKLACRTCHNAHEKDRRARLKAAGVERYWEAGATALR